MTLLPSVWRVSLFPIGSWGATTVEEGTTCPNGSVVSSTQNAIIVVAKDTLPEAAAQKELRLRPRHQKNQGTGDSGPEPSGCKLTENQTIQKIAWRIPWCARSKTERLILLMYAQHFINYIATYTFLSFNI